MRIKKYIIPFSILIILFNSIFFSGCKDPAINQIPVEESEDIVIYLGASRRISGGIPLVYLKGTPYERGFQHGVLMREEVIETARDYNDYVEYYYGGIENVRDRIYHIEQNMPGELVEKMHGIADGCLEVNYEDILLINTFYGIADACSSIAVKVNGEYIHLKNMDLRVDEEKLPFILYVEEDLNGNRMIYIMEFGAGWVVFTNGMNDKGISISGDAMPSFDKPIDNTDRLSDLVLRYRIIAESSTMEDVENIIKTFPIIGTRGFVVVSGFENKAAKFEICPEEYGKVISDIENIYMTNFFDTPNMRKFQNPTRFFDSASSHINGKAVCSRYNQLAKRLRESSFVNETDTAAILRDNTYYYNGKRYFGRPYINWGLPGNDILPDDVFGWLYSPYHPVHNLGTQFSLIMNPKQGHLYLSTGLSFSAFNKFTKVYMNGEVDDFWNINTETIAADEESQRRASIFNDFYQKIIFGRDNFLALCQEFISKDEENVVYYESYGRTLLKQDVEAAMNFFEETANKFSENILIKRLYAVSLFEVYKINKDSELLSGANSIYLELLGKTNELEVIPPGFKLDIFYRLMLISKEKENNESFQHCEMEFNKRLQELGNPGYYPYSAFINSIYNLKSKK